MVYLNRPATFIREKPPQKLCQESTTEYNLVFGQGILAFHAPGTYFAYILIYYLPVYILYNFLSIKHYFDTVVFYSFKPFFVHKLFCIYVLKNRKKEEKGSS